MKKIQVAHVDGIGVIEDAQNCKRVVIGAKKSTKRLRSHKTRVFVRQVAQNWVIVATTIAPEDWTSAI